MKKLEKNEVLKKVREDYENCLKNYEGNDDELISIIEKARKKLDEEKYIIAANYNIGLKEYGFTTHKINSLFLKRLIREELEKGINGSKKYIYNFCKKVIENDIDEEGVLKFKYNGTIGY